MMRLWTVILLGTLVLQLKYYQVSEAAFIDCDEGDCDCCVCLTGIDIDITPYCNILPQLTFFSDRSGDQGGLEVESGAFQNADHLISLDLSNSYPLILHNESFAGLINLEKLDLQLNQLSSLPDGVFEPLGNLTELDLNYNLLDTLSSKWLQGLVSLTTLYLGNNRFTSFPVDVLNTLPALVNVTLHPNLWNCSDIEDIIPLYHLVVTSAVIVDKDQLTCFNGTLIKDLVIEIEGSTSIYATLFPTPTVEIEGSTSIYATLFPTPTIEIEGSTSIYATLFPTPTIEIEGPTSIHATPFPTPTIPSTRSTRIFTSTPTPTLLQTYCQAETTITVNGYFNWPETAIGSQVIMSCPSGPQEEVAKRECESGGIWSTIMTDDCDLASETTQLLVEILQVKVMANVSVQVSEGLSSLPTSPSLTPQELNTLIEIATQLVDVAGDNVEVLNNTLLAVNNVVQYSGQVLTDGSDPTLSTKIRHLIDIILLDAVDANQTSLVLQFSHLAVGGAYLPSTNHTQLLVVVYGGEEGVVVGDFEEDVEVEVDVEVDGESDNTIVQVTFYFDYDLFNVTGECGEGNKGIFGDLTSVVVTVSESNPIETQIITVNYGNVQISGGDEAVCAEWDQTLNCGAGGWSSDSCTTTHSGDAYQCQCSEEGTIGLLDVVGTQSSTSKLDTVSKAVFYAFCGLTVPFYLIIIITLLIHRHLRALPTMQAIINMAVSQVMSFILLAISYERTEINTLCYTLATLQHYAYLVALSSMFIYPTLVCVRVFYRMWYERPWLIVPFLVVSWVLPAIPVAVYMGVKYSDFDNLGTCWLEAAVKNGIIGTHFPNYFTYVSSFTEISMLLLTAGCILLLACSDYTIDTTTYFQLISSFFGSLLFFSAMLAQFFTVWSGIVVNQEYLLMVTGALTLICALFFFITFGAAKNRVRSAMMCRDDPVLKEKVSHYNHGASRTSSNSSLHPKLHRRPIRLGDEMNINYVDAYLGNPAVANPVSLAMLGKVEQAQGKRVKSRKNSLADFEHQLSQVSSV